VRVHETGSRPLVEKFIKVAPEIFKAKFDLASYISFTPFIGYIIRKVGMNLRPVSAPPYLHERLAAAIREVIGDENASLKMSEMDQALAIVTVSYTHARPTVFRTRGLDPLNPAEVTLCDALVASASAPTFFPPKAIEYKGSIEHFIDGGVVANTPDIVGVTEAVGRLFCDPINVYMLSIGTAGSDNSGGPIEPKNTSAWRWLTKHKLIPKIIASQEVLAQELSRTLLAHRYQRIDHNPPEVFSKHIRDMDVCDNRAVETLQLLADRAWEDAAPRLRDAGIIR